MDTVILDRASKIDDVGQTLFNDLPNNVSSLVLDVQSNPYEIISEKSCLFVDNLTWRDIYTDTTVGYYSSNQEVKEPPTNNQLSVKIRKKIKIRCSL